MPDPIKPTAADEAAAETLFRAILGDVGSYAEWGYTSYREAAQRNIAQAFTLHAQQAREQALEEAATGVAGIAESIRKQASKNHPDSDRTRELMRQADELEMAADAIRALKEQPPC